MNKLVQGIGALLLVQGLLIGGYLLIESQKRNPSEPAHAQATARPERIGYEAPALGYRRADGTSGQLGAHRGQTLLLHFWATWCPPCRKELPALVELANEGGVEVLMVAMDPNWTSVRNFFGGDVPRGVVLAEAQDVQQRFATHVLPQSFVIDASGMMLWHFRGARDWRDPSVLAFARGGTRDD